MKVKVGTKIEYHDIRTNKVKTGMVVEKDEFEKEWYKVFTGKKTEDVHVGQIL